MLDSLFVYGSFAEGMVHYDRIQPYVRDAKPATAVGCVYRMPVGFPVYLAQGYSQIPGQLVTVSSIEVLFPLLDEFHGVSHLEPEKGLFLRLETEVRVFDDEAPSRCWIYALQQAKLPKTAKLIEGGDWRRSLNENPALPMKLTEKQKSYIRRLAQCSGRDIVPIDMALYRELLHLDLVVDKGRRLALTPLGHDVNRFLG